MAKEKDKDKLKAGDAGEKKKKPGLIASIVPVLLVTLIAGGGGFAFGHFLLASKPSQEKAADEANPAGEEKTAEGEKPAESEPGQIVRQLAPIVTNLQAPKEAWIRLEIAIVLKPEAAANQDVIAVESGDKVLGLLRTIALPQIEGPSGLLHLREDLTDLLVEGEESPIRQVLISSMVVE